MQAITGISNQSAQIINVAVPDGSTATITLKYRPQQLGWFFDLTWNGVNPAMQINGRRVTSFPNLLRQFRNILSFGLACITADSYEPLGVDDFDSGYAQLIVLSADDVALIENQIFPGNLQP